MKKYLYSTVWAALFLFLLALDHFTGKGKLCIIDMKYSDIFLLVFFASAPTIFLVDELRNKRK